MRLVFLILILSSLSFDAFAQTKVHVEVHNFKNNKGICRIGVFDNAAAFAGKGNPVKSVYVNIENGKAKAVIDLAAGTYAIAVLHDENNNDQLDTNFIGIPKEGYGASRNKLPFASAPSFKENEFIVAEKPVYLNIKLRYLY